MKRINETPAIREFFLDDNTNDKIISYIYKKRIVVKLKLASEKGRIRLLGTITKSTRTIILKRIEAKHLFRKSNAYGFNEVLLSHRKNYDTVWLKDDKGNEWKIPAQHIIDNGSYLYFKQEGFEKQLFLSKEQMDEFKLTKKDINQRRF